MSRKDDEDRLDALISQAVDLGKIEFDRRKWLDRLAVQAQEPSLIGTCVEDTKHHTSATIWRKIMESKAAKYSVAATILVAASLVLVNPFSGSRRGVVLGEVAQKLSETHTVIHKQRRLVYRPGEDKPFFTGEVQNYFSTDRGMVEEQYDPNGALLYRICLPKEPRQVTILFPKVKKYIRAPAPKDLYEQLGKMIEPAGLVNYLTSVPYTKLGRSQRDGFEVEGFEATDFDLSWLPAHTKYLFPIQNLTARLFIDVRTDLPVGAEIKVDADRGLMTYFQKVHVEITTYDYEWNAEIPAGTFDPNIPADYTPIDLGSLGLQKAAWLGVGALPAAGLVVYRRRRARNCRVVN
jgi:hypothetical protein